MKKFIGFILIGLFYVGLFWVFPYVALTNKEDIWIVEIGLHSIVAGCYLFARLLIWLFD